VQCNASINVMPNYHRYRLRVGEGRGWWGNGPLSFSEVVEICHCLRSIHFDHAIVSHESQVLLLGDLSGNTGDCTINASPVGGEL